MKTPEQRGPLGAWAYDSRVAIGLSVEQVAAALPSKPHPASLRKAESNSRNMSRPLWRALTAYYRSRAAEGGLTLDEIPVFDDADRVPDEADLVVAIRAQTDSINALIEELRLGRAQQEETARVTLHALGSLGAISQRPGREGSFHADEPEEPVGTPR